MKVYTSELPNLSVETMNPIVEDIIDLQDKSFTVFNLHHTYFLSQPPKLLIFSRFLLNGFLVV